MGEGETVGGFLYSWLRRNFKTPSQFAAQAKACRCAVVIGSEGRGVSPELLRLSEKTMKIPMRERCESLNAAVAAAIVLWEMGR